MPSYIWMLPYVWMHPVCLDVPYMFECTPCMFGCHDMCGDPLYVWMPPMFGCYLYIWTPPVCLDAPLHTQHKESMLCHTKQVSICPHTFWCPCMFECHPYVWTPPVCLDPPYVWMPQYVWTPPYIWMPHVWTPCCMLGWCLDSPCTYTMHRKHAMSH